MNSATTKKVDELRLADLESFPVWEFTNADEGTLGETAVRPVKKTPVNSLSGRVVGTQVRLSSGAAVWALIGNVDSDDPSSTQHFLSLSVFHKGRRFDMARYHDFDWCERGPRALAAFLEMGIDEVFPISYDIRHLCIGHAASLAGTIEKEPRERLSPAQLIELAVP